MDVTAANHIYANELAGTEVSFDSAQVSGASDLLSAVAADNSAATLAAVRRLVFHPAWHIVRLRVLDTAGRVLVDFGGAHVIAPVAGVLRLHGRVIGRYLMSVQDDTGFTKLETRFVGDPIGIYVDSTLVAERFASFPGTPPATASLSLGGVSYLVRRETYRSFPTGSLNATLLVGPATAAVQAQPCALVRAGEFGRIAERFASLAISLAQHYPGFARTVHVYTGAEVFVRDGPTQLAASGGSAPSRLPTAGVVRWRGTSWLVFSFEPIPPARVYLLIPPS